MILKASQRGGAKQLGLHLLKTDDNEHIELHEIRGFVSDDLIGALKEAYAVSRGTKCKQFMFSVSLNPPQLEDVGIDLFEQTIDRIEEVNGLSGQPRVIVFHEKEGRRHGHAVWSRIDADEMKAINLPFFKTKLREISRSLYMEHDWVMPRGLMDSEARDPRNYDLAEHQQAKRMGLDARDLKAEMQECWAVSDSRAAFEHALSERGMILAKGDRRGHVAVTHEGEVLSIARYIGKKAKEVTAKIGEPKDLLSVNDAKVQMAHDMSRAFNRHLDEARAKHSVRAAELEEQRLAMREDHQTERAKLDEAQKERWARETQERQDRFNKGMRGLWDRLTGRHAALKQQNEQEAYAALIRDREQRDSIVAAQLHERRSLQTQILKTRQETTRLLSTLHQEQQRYEPQRPEPVQDDKSPRRRSKIPVEPTVRAVSEPKPQEAQKPKTHLVPPPESVPERAAQQRVRRQEHASTPVQKPAPEPLPVQQTEEPPPPVQDHFERVKGPRNNAATPNRQDGDRGPSSSPTPEDRLQALRHDTDNQPAPPEKGPERER